MAKVKNAGQLPSGKLTNGEKKGPPRRGLLQSNSLAPCTKKEAVGWLERYGYKNLNGQGRPMLASKDTLRENGMLEPFEVALGEYGANWLTIMEENGVIGFVLPDSEETDSRETPEPVLPDCEASAPAEVEAGLAEEKSEEEQAPAGEGLMAAPVAGEESSPEEVAVAPEPAEEQMVAEAADVVVSGSDPDGEEAKEDRKPVRRRKGGGSRKKAGKVAAPKGTIVITVKGCDLDLHTENCGGSVGAVACYCECRGQYAERPSFKAYYEDEEPMHIIHNDPEDIRAFGARKTIRLFPHGRSISLKYSADPADVRKHSFDYGARIFEAVTSSAMSEAPKSEMSHFTFDASAVDIGSCHVMKNGMGVMPVPIDGKPVEKMRCFFEAAWDDLESVVFVFKD